MVYNSGDIGHSYFQSDNRMGLDPGIRTDKRESAVTEKCNVNSKSECI